MLGLHIVIASSLLIFQAGRAMLVRSRYWHLAETYGKPVVYISGIGTVLTGTWLLSVAPLAVVCVRGSLLAAALIGLEFLIRRLRPVDRYTETA